MDPDFGESGQAILDLGTGTGSLARGFARRGATVAGLDISEPMLDAAGHPSCWLIDTAWRERTAAGAAVQTRSRGVDYLSPLA